MSALNAIRNVAGFATKSGRGKFRIGYVPEHFSTPLAFAKQHFSLSADLIPFPTGTGALATALKLPLSSPDSIDVAIGLTEGFVADLGKAKSASQEPGYGLIGTYVESPLCWAISTGAQKAHIKSVADLKASRVGVSRIGSGSYVMSFVLADQQGWLRTKDPFDVLPIGDFAALRKSVNEGSSDFFMWEHFTTKHYWDNGELKRIGEIFTPWPSWMIAARAGQKEEIRDMTEKINLGIAYYRDHKDEAVRHITSTMHYSKEDALEWMKTVRFAEDVRGVKARTVDNTASVLRKAGVLDESAGGSEHMIHEIRPESGNPLDE